ncbi:MAG: hypothetical protein V3V08_14720 [Nannocystaceae bacterium]
MWFADGEAPGDRVIEGRTEGWVLDIESSSHLNFTGLTLFAGAFHTSNSTDLHFDECRFLYSSASKTMLGEYLTPSTNALPPIPQIPQNLTEGSAQSIPDARLQWTNCEFAYSEGRALALDTHGNTVENCWFHNSSWGPTTFGVVGDKKGGATIYRRNTIHTIGRSHGTKSGRNAVIEYNRTYNFMFMGDSCGHQMPSGTQGTVQCHHNWVYNAYHRNGFRFDGDPAGTGGTIHHNVSMHNHRGFRLKGDEHTIVALTALMNGPKDDINVASQKFYADPETKLIQAGNRNSVVRNIAAYCS